MSEQFESTFRSHKNTELFFHQWKCQDPKGTILITHGIGEHSECYKELAEELNKQKFNVVAYDLRGHGRSEGRRGVVDNFSDFCDDLELFLDFTINNFKGPLPLHLFAHSLGSLITMRTLLSRKTSQITSVILSAPCFALKIKVPTWKEKLSKFGSEWIPNVTLWNEIRYEDLVRNVEKARSYANDPLRHDKISPRLFLGMMESMQFIKENESNFQLPVIVQIAGQDKICDPESGIRFYENCGSQIKKIHIYDDSLHEVYNDLDRDQVIRDLLIFLKKFETSKKES
jgi:alpha-beta hydrolase superfamily lysophospholipase